MDARVNGEPITPRDGCAIEIEALWYHLLAFLEHLETAAGNASAARAWSAARAQAGETFLQRFWLVDERRLADVWRPSPGGGTVDRAVRPNMVIAASLEWSPLSREQRADIVACARAELLTPFGLRTLGPTDPDYHGRYGGNVVERDHAYHQGTVWPWLLGAYVEACLRCDALPRDELRALLDGFGPHLEQAGVGHVSEVFDGDPPHSPGGAFAQAWSEAELLRAWKMLDESAP
jgi:predicted glycogen debranching enzyme